MVTRLPTLAPCAIVLNVCAPTLHNPCGTLVDFRDDQARDKDSGWFQVAGAVTLSVIRPQALPYAAGCTILYLQCAKPVALETVPSLSVYRAQGTAMSVCSCSCCPRVDV